MGYPSRSKKRTAPTVSTTPTPVTFPSFLQKCLVLGLVFKKGSRFRSRKQKVFKATSSAEADPLQWLEELDSPPVRAWVESQNALSLSSLGDPRHSPLLARLGQTETTDTDADPLRSMTQIFML
eukprot:Skav233123  [mRNA]  locus=scaffold792:3008:6300:+ [translate_table: standard]